MSITNFSNQNLMHYIHQVEQFFKNDKEVNVIYSERDNILDLYVNSSRKAYALSTLMPETVTFNNTTININVIPLCDKVECDLSGASLYTEAFLDNPVFISVRSVLYYPNNLIYILLKPEIVKFFDGDLKNYNGCHHMLYEDIARNIFVQQDNVFFCTDPVKEN